MRTLAVVCLVWAALTVVALDAFSLQQLLRADASKNGGGFGCVGCDVVVFSIQTEALAEEVVRACLAMQDATKWDSWSWGVSEFS